MTNRTTLHHQRKRGVTKPGRGVTPIWPPCTSH